MKRTVEEARRGDPEAIRSLVEAHYPSVLRFMTTLCANPADAEDLTQEAFVQALRSIRKFRGRAVCALGSTASPTMVISAPEGGSDPRRPFSSRAAFSRSTQSQVYCRTYVSVYGSAAKDRELFSTFHSSWTRLNSTSLLSFDRLPKKANVIGTWISDSQERLD